MFTYMCCFNVFTFLCRFKYVQIHVKFCSLLIYIYSFINCSITMNNISDCGALENPQFGTVSTAGGTTFGEVAVYYCNVGYSLIGNNERNCEADGLWSGTIPVCEIKGLFINSYHIASKTLHVITLNSRIT